MHPGFFTACVFSAPLRAAVLIWLACLSPGVFAQVSDGQGLTPLEGVLPITDDRALWDSVKDSRDVNELRIYLKQFPNGLFAALANLRVRTLEQAAVAPVALPAAESAAIKAAPPKPQPSPQKAEEIIVSPGQARVGHAWVKAMPSGSSLVIYATEPSYAEASAWMKSRPEIKNLHIVANYGSQGADLKFSIAAGPFGSRLEAMRFARGVDMPKGAWALPLKSMTDRLSRESADTASTEPKVTR